ncbi:glycoside hydrolase [Spirochaetia bacterium]|nr:glycoside hydrolase [Spirochaetia bacterium]
MKYTDAEIPERGMFYKGKGRASQPLYPYEEVKDRLPRPLLPSHPAWLGCYHYAWRIAFSNARYPEPGSGFISNFVDAAFNQDFFLWDTVFISMFTDLAGPLLPGIEALDNFYAKQLPDGEIPREMVRQTGADVKFWINHEGLPLHSYFHNHYGFRKLFTQAPPKTEEMYFPDLGRPQKTAAWYTLDNLNHPLLAWAELVSCAQTGNVRRLLEVFPPLLQQYYSMQQLLQHANGLYVTDWASMDNSPRNKYLGCAVDTSCEMALFAGNLLDMLDILEQRSLCQKDEELRCRLESDRAGLSQTINRMMWDEKTGFYYDLKPDGSRAPVKTIAAFWALAAGVADKAQAERLARWLQDPSSFNRLHRVPVCAADEEGYDPRGGYWRGSVWAPTNTMVLYGLEKYGYNDLAREIALNHVDAVARVWEDTGSIWENYPADSISSADADRKDFVGWSGIGPIRYLLRYGVGLAPDALHNTLRWNLDMDLLQRGEIGCDHFYFAGRETDLRARIKDGQVVITVNSDGDYTLTITAGSKKYTRQIKGREEIGIPIP